MYGGACLKGQVKGPAGEECQTRTGKDLISTKWADDDKDLDGEVLSEAGSWRGFSRARTPF